MKPILNVILAVLITTACNKGDDPKPADNFYIKPNAMVNIKPSAGVVIKSSNHLTALEIVKQTIGISFQNIVFFGNQSVNCGFSEPQRDTISNPPMLHRWATDLINIDGFDNYYLVPDFMDAEDIVFFRVINSKRDTIAYTPNSVMKQIQNDVRSALSNKDTTLAYKAFNSWTFTPITGLEWRELKKQGKQ